MCRFSAALITWRCTNKGVFGMTQLWVCQQPADTECRCVGGETPISERRNKTTGFQGINEFLLKPFSFFIFVFVFLCINELLLCWKSQKCVTNCPVTMAITLLRRHTSTARLALNKAENAFYEWPHKYLIWWRFSIIQMISWSRVMAPGLLLLKSFIQVASLTTKAKAKWWKSEKWLYWFSETLNSWLNNVYS